MLSLMVLATLSGCAVPTPTLGLGDLSNLPPPIWRVGESWHYLNSKDGTWENWTVAAQEIKNGFDSYRVTVDSSRFDNFTQTKTSVRWIDAKTLGMVAGKMGYVTYEFACPQKQIFPLIAKHYHCNATLMGYPSGFTEGIRIGNVSRIPTPAGVFDAVEVESYSRQDNVKDNPPSQLDEDSWYTSEWYSPEVGNLIQSGTVVLQSWSNPP